MSKTTAGYRDQLLVAVVDVVFIVGMLSLVGVALLVQHLPVPVGSPTQVQPVWILAFVAAAAIAEKVGVRVLHGDQSEDLTFFEIVIVSSFLVLPAPWCLVAPILGLAISQLAVRRSIMKSAFNLGSYAMATSWAYLVFVLVSNGTDRFSARSVLGLLLAMIVFAVINTLWLALILYLSQGVTVREAVEGFWTMAMLMSGAGIGVGAIAVAVAPISPALLPFALVPALALWHAYRSVATEMQVRERNAWLVTLAGLVTQDQSLETLSTDAADAVRQAFGAGRAIVLLDERAARYDEVLDEAPQAVPAELLPESWTSAVAVRLDLADGRRGALVLGTGEGDKSWSLGEQDAAVLTTVAASISSAVRGIEHRDALVEESSKLKAVVEHVSDGIAVLTSNGTVTLWSPAMARITGVSPSVAARTSGEVPDPLVRLRSLAAGSASQRAETAEVPIVRPDGEQRDVSVNVVTARPADGDPVAVVTVHDITSQARTDRLKSDFVATISHELRTPLTPIKGYAQLLLARYDKMTDEQREHALGLIAERADHMGRLVEDLLMASRASGTHTLASKLASAPTPHDLRDVVAEATSNFPALGARLTVDQPLAAVPVFCDEVRAVQIVSNLVSNAAKYSPEDAPISVRIHPSEFGESHARVDVIDRGQGISQDDLERVFERFYRVEDSLTMRTSGSGLGLYIARELAVAMGGALTVTSSPGRGSTFSLTLPRTEDGAKSTTSTGTDTAYARTA